MLDETFVVNATGHHPMETRSAMAYWRGDTLYLHCSTQSVIRTVEPVARWVGIDPSKVVLICEYTGGGFGSKGAGAVSMAIPAVLSKKVDAPVMMRVSREEESYFGRARTNMTGRAKIGFAKDGRIQAMDLFVVQDNGPYGPMGDWRSGANAASLVYQPQGDAHPRRQRLHQHAAAHPAALARADAVQRHRRGRADQGGQAARHRSGGDAARERPRGQGALRAR